MQQRLYAAARRRPLRQFPDTAFRAAFDFYVGLVPRTGWRRSPSVNDMPNPYQEFARGTFAMYITGPWNIGEFKRRLPRLAAGTPGRRRRSPAPHGDSAGIRSPAAPASSCSAPPQHKAEAWQLIEYLSEPAQQLDFYAPDAAICRRASALATIAARDRRYAHAFSRQLDRVDATPKVPEWERIDQRDASSQAEHIDPRRRRARTVDGDAGPGRQRPFSTSAAGSLARLGARRCPCAVSRRSSIARARRGCSSLPRSCSSGCSSCCRCSRAFVLSLTDFDLYALADLEQSAVRRRCTITWSCCTTPLFWTALGQYSSISSSSACRCRSPRRWARRCC